MSHYYNSKPLSETKKKTMSVIKSSSKKGGIFFPQKGKKKIQEVSLWYAEN